MPRSFTTGAETCANCAISSLAQSSCATWMERSENWRRRLPRGPWRGRADASECQAEGSGMRSIVRNVKDRAEAHMIQGRPRGVGLESSPRRKISQHQLPGASVQDPATPSRAQGIFLGPACLTDSGPQKSARHTFVDLAGRFCKNLSCSRAHTHRIGHPLCE